MLSHCFVAAPAGLERASVRAMDDATALAERIARRELSCVELMRACLERIERANPALNAIVSLREPDALLAEAAERDAELARGERRGWMHGLPHAIKDLEDTAGIVTTSGSPLFADHVPDADSEVVRRIRAAGAIVIGKTNVPEFGYGSQTYNDVFGPTRNPYDPTRTAGARAAARRRRWPRAWCRSPTAATTWAPCATRPRSATSTASARRSAGSSPARRAGVRGPDRHRRADGPQPARPRRAARHARRPPSRRAVLDRGGPGGAWPRRSSRADPARLRIGWLGDLGGHLPFEPGILELCEAALRALGADVVPVEPGFDPDAAWEAAVTLRHYDATWALELPRERLKPEIRWEAEGALAVTGPALHEAQVVRTQVAAALRALLRSHDALALPSAQVFPFDVGTPWPGEVAGPPHADLPPVDGGR